MDEFEARMLGRLIGGLILTLPFYLAAKTQLEKKIPEKRKAALASFFVVGGLFLFLPRALGLMSFTQAATGYIPCLLLWLTITLYKLSRQSPAR